MIEITPISTITAAIKLQLAPDVAGLTIWDLPDMTTTIQGRDCPVLFPELRNGFALNWKINPDTHGGEGERTYIATYNLQYSLAYQAIGASRGLWDVMPGMQDMVKTIVAAQIKHDHLGGVVVEFLTSGITGDGTVLDPDGNVFFGKTFNFEITEYIGE